MALPTVNVNQLGGGTGRPAPGFDYYSGLIFYGTAPSVSGKWTSYPGPPIVHAQQMFSASDATSAGILPFTDNVAASGSIRAGSGSSLGTIVAGDIITITDNMPAPMGLTTPVVLCSYTTVAGDISDTTGAALALSLKTAINNLTVSTGFSAGAITSVNTLALAAPKSAGVSLNAASSLVVTVSNSHTFTNTIVDFSGGTASPYAAWSYHISEYFRINPTGNIWVGIIATSSSFNEVQTIMTASGNKIRQTGIYDTDTTRPTAANITGTITQLEAACQVTQKTAPFSAFYSPNIKAISDLSTYPDQNLNTANKVQTIISQDGGAAGALLFLVNGQTIGNIGAKLGSVSSSRVSASDAQPIAQFNMSDGIENNIPAFGNGLLSSAVSNGIQVQLDNYNYTFFRQFGDQVVGTYWTGNKCCINSSSDYANVNDNRVSDKVSRICYSTLIPYLNAELIFNTDGTLQNYTIEIFKRAVENAVTAAMITGFGSLPLISGIGVDIDPTQPVQKTNNLTIVVTIVENGIARNITVNIGYGTL